MTTAAHAAVPVPVPGPGATRTLVLMGVSGCGKSTVAAQVVAATGWTLAEGDDFHPPANVATMHAGHPLTDDDRWPWLAALGAWIGRHEEAGASAVLTCSALRRSYRDLLRTGHPSVFFVHLDVPVDELARRLARRQGHYMPASLLQSQLDTLEPLAPDEPGTSVPGAPAPEVVAARVLGALRATGALVGRPVGR